MLAGKIRPGAGMDTVMSGQKRKKQLNVLNLMPCLQEGTGD